jgi:two-component system cell cycle sensor histidine kinase/response regulator CckA
MGAEHEKGDGRASRPESGSVRSAAAIDQEVTEETLKASEDNFRALFENTSDAILIADLATRSLQYANPAAVRMLGYSDSELREMKVADLHPAEAMDRVLSDFEGLSAGRKTLAADIPCLRRDGTVVYADVCATPVTIDGQAMSAGFFRDVTERRRATLALEASEARYRTLFHAIEQAAEAIVITDTQGAISYVNPAFEKVTGYSRAEALGSTPRLLKSGAQDEELYRTLWVTIASGGTWRGRLVNRRKDGTLFTEEATISPVRDDAGTIISYVAVKRDVTATLALEAQFLQAQKMEAVGQLAGGVAHDFNNILSVILSYAEAIADEVDEPARGDAEEIRIAALRAASLTKQLLAFSRQQVLQPRVLCLNETIGQVQRMMRRLLGADITLTTVPAGGLWNVEADPGKVEQVLMNLAVNARDAMPGGGELTIETANVELDEEQTRAHAAPAGSYVMVALTDTGVGMDATTKARLFEPFFTTKEAGRGTGLGLATVFGIVKQSRGHIEVLSEAGKGTTFRVYLPRTLRTTQLLSERPPPESVHGSETVLLVEDDDQVRVVAGDILRRNGYVVLDASNGGEALLVCEQHGGSIDLLVTDLVMPRMNGRQLADRLARLHPEMKVLFMSGYTDDAHLQRGAIDPDAAYLQKPLTPASLALKVREVLGGAGGG